MNMRWEGERTDAERDRDRAARELARRTSLSRKANRRSWWLYGFAAACFAMALAFGITATFGTATAVICTGLVLIAAALVA